MQNTTQKVRQSSIVFKKLDSFVWKFENFDSSIFFAENSHTFPTYSCLQKGMQILFKEFCLDLELFAKIKNIWFLHTCFFTFLLITLIETK